MLATQMHKVNIIDAYITYHKRQRYIIVWCVVNYANDISYTHLITTFWKKRFFTYFQLCRRSTVGNLLVSCRSTVGNLSADS
ncbi:hypothetical protein pdam_00025831 [Pocillopora damicornis]|uniref:Uncharacterized protein n=1 Tax=Pocillopora damicornis TaxID=46731 RepID=A0A3M6T4B7_POCDA|nr:hypothetical protein pdam_00025831 [Pocillopora damicornis]